MPTHYESLRSLSLDDPEAGKKLIENLDGRQIRLDIRDLCREIGIESPSATDFQRAMAFLDGLCAAGELVKEYGLYCRPDMKKGRPSVKEAIQRLTILRKDESNVPEPKIGEKKESRAEYRKRISAERIALRKVIEEDSPPVPVPSKEKRSAYPKRTSEIKSAALKRMKEEASGLLPESVAEPPKLSPTPNRELLPPMPVKDRTVTSLQKQMEWILCSLRIAKGGVDKSVLAQAGIADGILASKGDIDHPLQPLLDRNRVYVKDRMLALSRFGEQEADYLIIRREALQIRLPDAPRADS
jgi:hypothetical protein